MSDRTPLTPDIDVLTCAGMDAALAQALNDAATLGSGFVMIHNTDSGLRADYMPFDVVGIAVDKLAKHDDEINKGAAIADDQRNPSPRDARHSYGQSR